jgi:methionine aminotransferase
VAEIQTHALRSKLPDVGTTIFTVMSRRAAELGAINLGQGFPDYDVDALLIQCIHEAMQRGANQYAPMTGVPALREAIARKIERFRGVRVDPEHEITVTLGATEAIYSAVQALIGPGEEAIVFDPSYDSYDPAIRLAGAHCVHVPLLPPQFRPDWERVRAAINERTRLVIVNSPHNPACSCLDAADLDALAELLRGRDCRVIADEVYEHMVFDGRAHASVLGHAELRARSVAVYSFGKTLHSTGLRVGYAVAPAALTAELRKVHQFNCFSVSNALQVGIASYLGQRSDCGADLPAFFQARRDFLLAQLRGSDWEAPPAAGSFFQLIDYRAFSTQPDVTMAEQLLIEAGVATIPLSVFYQSPPPLHYLRLCFAKREATLEEGAARLRRWAEGARAAGTGR